MKRLLLLSFFLLFVAPLFAQNQSLPGQKATDVYVYGAGYLLDPQPSSIADFRKLAPESELLQADFSGYTVSHDSWNQVGSGFSGLVGFQFLNRDKSGYRTNPLLRLGVQYVRTSIFTSDFEREFRTPYDTLISSVTNEVHYIDSVNYQSYEMAYVANNFRIDASLIYRTNPSARWSLYAGMGASVGLTFNTKTTIERARYVTEESAGGDDSYFREFEENGGVQYNNEEYRNDAGFSSSLYVPLGIDFRMATVSEFWRRIHLYFETRPGLNMSSVPELGFFINPYVQTGFGLRVDVTQ